MARRTKASGRSTTRKPVTLDLKAEEVSKKDPEPKTGRGAVPKPEPVAMAKPAAKKTAADKVKAQSETSESRPEKRTAAPKPAPQPKAEPKPAPASTAPSGNRGLSSLTGGLVGGVIALVGAAGLQWSGVLPSMAPAPVAEPAEMQDLSPLEAEIASLRDELSAVQSATPDTSAADAQMADTQTAVENLASQLADLEQAMSSGQAGEAPGLEALSGRLDDVQSQLEALAAQPPATADDAGSISSDDLAAQFAPLVSGLEEQLGEVATDAADMGRTVEGLTGELATLSQSVTGIGEGQSQLSDAVSGIETRIDALSEELAQSNPGNLVVRAVAASGLTTAVDRGLPFMAELEAFATAGGEEQTVSALRDYAAQGVPTSAQLVERFGPVANDIVAAGRGVDGDASIADRLMSSARSLVQVRPVGEVEGDTPGAIAARMEARLKDGDLGGFLSQWETLPDAAKEVSSAFADDVRARQSVNTLTLSIFNQPAASPAADTQ